MRKIYITKEDLLNDLENVKIQLDKKSVGPFAYLVVFVGVILSLLMFIPIIALWLLLLVLYIPGFLLDNIILKLLYKGKNK